MMIVGYALFAETVAYVPTAATFTLGALVLPTIYLPALAHLMLAYPTGTLRSHAERALVVAAYAATVVVSVVCHLFAPPSSTSCAYCRNLLLVRGSASLDERIREVSGVFTAGFVVVVVATIVARWTFVRGVARRSIAPAFWTALVAGCYVMLVAMRATFPPDLPPTVYLYGCLTLAVLP